MKRIVPIGLALVVLAAGFLATGPAQAKRPDAYMICNRPSENLLPFPQEKPKRCVMLDEGDSFSEGINLAHLRWSHWDTHWARFRGRSLGFHLPYSKLPVQGRLFRPRHDYCGGGKKTYFTRLMIRSKYGRSLYRIDPCVGQL